MIKEQDTQHIQMVLGDTLRAIFIVEGVEDEEATAAVFICKDLNLEIPLIPSNTSDNEDSEDSEELTGQQEWLLQYDGELRPGTFYYDFMIKNVLTRIVTYIYHGRLTILPKVPPKTTYNPYYEYPHNTKKDHE